MWPAACGQKEKKALTRARGLISGKLEENAGRAIFGQTGALNNRG